MTADACACRVIVRGPLSEIRYCAAHGAGPAAIRKLALVEADAARLAAEHDRTRAELAGTIRQLGETRAAVRSLRIALHTARDLLAERRMVAEALAADLAQREGR